MVIKQEDKTLEPTDLHISVPAWEALIRHIPDVNKALEEEREEEIKIHLSKHLVTHTNYNEWKVGFHTIGLGGLMPKFTMNFSLAEWQIIQDNVELLCSEIAKCPKLRKQAYTKPDKKEKPKVVMYNWQVTDGSKATVIEGEEYQYTTKMAQAELELAKEKPQNKEYLSSKFNWTLYSQYREGPSMFVLTRRVFVEVMRELIAKVREQKCEACKAQHSSLGAHAGPGGCEEELSRDEIVRLYYDEARTKLTYYKLVCVIDQCLSIISATGTWTYTYVKCYLNFSDEDADKQRLVEPRVVDSVDKLIYLAFRNVKNDMSGIEEYMNM